MIKKILTYVIGSLVAAALFYVLYALCFSNAAERALRQENIYLEEHYGKLLSRSALVDSVLNGLEARDAKIYNNILNTDPPSVDALLGQEDDSRLDQFYAAGELQLIDEGAAALDGLLTTSAQIDREIRAIYARMTDESFKKNNCPCIIPLRNFTLAATGATKGKKMNPFFKSITDHGGIDLMAPYGSEVLATADGRVVEVLRQDRGLGNMVIIDHGNGLRTVYAHLSDIYVAINQNVKQGKVIGKVGNSGASFTASLHYEVRKGGRAMDPVNYFFASLSPSAYSDMLIIANTTGQSLD
ncbi:MAG: M23 family metallopeptidase [Bacteroidales bacterium]|nr:M23 family metallopeptidase [Bacteroidales bacterium]